jgi:hypothetical protein
MGVGVGVAGGMGVDSEATLQQLHPQAEGLVALVVLPGRPCSFPVWHQGLPTIAPCLLRGSPARVSSGRARRRRRPCPTVTLAFLGLWLTLHRHRRVLQ